MCPLDVSLDATRVTFVSLACAGLAGHYFAYLNQNEPVATLPTIIRPLVTATRKRGTSSLPMESPSPMEGGAEAPLAKKQASASDDSARGADGREHGRAGRLPRKAAARGTASRQSRK